MRLSFHQQRQSAVGNGIMRRFHASRSGNVSMMFGLLIIPVTATVGLAVDFVRAYRVMSHTQIALDAASLAAGRVAQVEKVDTVTKASAAASAYFNQAKPKDVVSSTLQFSPNSLNTEFTVTAVSWVRTPFLGTLFVLSNQSGEAGAPASCSSNRFGCISVTTTSTAELKVGGEGGSNVEVSLMLDVTGSMCDPCTKIDAAKASAKDLIDIVIWDDQSTYTSKIALAPFAEAVNVGTTLAPLVRGTVAANNSTGSGSSGPQLFTSAATLNDVTNQPTKKWIKFTEASGSVCTTTACTYQISSKCVTERIGAQAYTDAPPTTAFVGKAYFGSTDTCGVANYSDAEVNSIQPLSNDKTMLKRRIDKLSTGGSTAGQLGTAWAWYLLSPKWGYLFPSASVPGSYSDVTALNSSGVPKLRKIAVLMTDGDYNINYCKGVEAKNSDQSPDINCNSENGKAVPQAASLCTGLKSSGIEVFTVGFQVSSASKTFLTACATDASHFYDATTADALKQAFRDIALKISKLRLTH